jgi:hypothetical protein
MVKRMFARFGRFDKHFQICARRRLSGEVIKGKRTNGLIDIVTATLRRNEA